MGGMATLGVYGMARGRKGAADTGEWKRSALPMLMLAGGYIGFIVATRYGPVSLTTPLTVVVLGCVERWLLVAPLPEMRSPGMFRFAATAARASAVSLNSACMSMPDGAGSRDVEWRLRPRA